MGGEKGGTVGQCRQRTAVDYIDAYIRKPTKRDLKNVRVCVIVVVYINMPCWTQKSIHLLSPQRKNKKVYEREKEIERKRAKEKHNHTDKYTRLIMQQKQLN